MNKLITSILAGLTLLCASAADGDLKTTTVNGITWTYTVVSENAKTCKLGGRQGEESYYTTIATTITGAITTPATLGGYSVIALGRGSFRECQISSITVSPGVTRIEDKVFFECQNLTSVSLPAGVLHIGEEAFSECPFSAITLPESLIRIGEQAFEHTNLTSITLPKNVAYLGNEDRIDEDGYVVEEDDLYGDVFNDCEYLQEVKVAPENQTYADIDGILVTKDLKTLLYCPPAKSEVVIPEGIEVIYRYTFSESPLTHITLPSTLTTIEEGAFESSALVEIAIGKFFLPTLRSSSESSVTIGDEAFYYCSDLTTVILGSNVSAIGSDAFLGCSSLTDVYNYASEPQPIDEYTFTTGWQDEEPWGPMNTATLHVMQDCLAAYKNAEGWKLFNQIVGMAETHLGDLTGDGQVDIADVNAVINMMLGKTSQTAAGDVNGDGKVDIADVNAVINIMLGK